MANYRQIHTKIWRDNWFLELDTDEKLLFIYLFSNDNSNLAGIYELNERIIQLETGLDKNRITGILSRFARDKNVFYQTRSKYFKHFTKGKKKTSPLRSQFNYLRNKAWAYLLDNGEPKCAYCGSTDDLQIDHIKPISKGGTNDFDNLQILCKKCNCRKADKYVQ